MAINVTALLSNNLTSSDIGLLFNGPIRSGFIIFPLNLFIGAESCLLDDFSFDKTTKVFQY
jgi:hypothetical protein